MEVIKGEFLCMIDYEELKKQNRLLILPCVEGDTVYKVKINYEACFSCGDFITPIGEISVCRNQEVTQKGKVKIFTPYITDKPLCEKQKAYTIEEIQAELLWIVGNIRSFGKTIFTTRAEAETKIAELQEKYIKKTENI